MPTLKDMAKQPPPSVTTEVKKEETTVINTSSGGTADFNTAWSEYIADLNSKNKSSLVGILGREVPVVKADNSFSVTAPNKVVADRIEEEEKQDMLVFLRRRTGNPALNLVIEINQVETTVQPYTSKEKFESLADKNPKLRDLKNALDLEIE